MQTIEVRTHVKLKELAMSAQRYVDGKCKSLKLAAGRCVGEGGVSGDGDAVSVEKLLMQTREVWTQVKLKKLAMSTQRYVRWQM